MLVLSGVILMLAGAGYVLWGRVVGDTERRIRQLAADVDRVLNARPKVTHAGVTIVQGTQATSELSTIEKTFEYSHLWESTWLGSTKRIQLKGWFIARAGYDLSEGFSLDVSGEGKSIRVHLPPARVHSVEMVRMEVLRDENGLWNRILPEEREEVMNTLLMEARRSLEETRILDEAEEAMMVRIEMALRRNASPEVVVERAPQP